LPNFATLLCLKYIFAKEITTIRKKKMAMEKKEKTKNYLLSSKFQLPKVSKPIFCMCMV
jgi:hypothetical protein